jgi:hypothetical protein
MENDEKTIRFLEEHIPELAQAAVTQAYWSALASGSVVLERKGDALVKTHPDGTVEFVRKLPPLTPVTPGQRYTLR